MNQLLCHSFCAFRRSRFARTVFDCAAKLRESVFARSTIVIAATLGFASVTDAEPKARVVYEADGENGQSISLEWEAIASSIYDLEISEDLKEWERVEGFPTVGEDDTMMIPFSSGMDPLFYRLTESVGPHGPPASLRLMSGFKYSREARISLFFRLANSQSEPVQLSTDGSIAIYEGGKLIDPDESIVKVTRNPQVDKYSLLLFDLSGSLFSNAGNFQKLRDAAEVYLRSVFADGNHYVDIGYFASDVVTHQNTSEPYYVQRNFGYQNDLEAALSLLDQIANTVPNDLSTNLFGALHEGHELLSAIESSSEDATIRNLVVLTDGDDSAGVYSETQVRDLIAAENAKSNGTTFYLVRVGAGSGDDVLESFDFESLHFANEAGALEEPFASIADRMDSESEGLLRVEYESTKRAGEIDAEVVFADGGSELAYAYTYDATGFQSSELRLWWHDHDDGNFSLDELAYLVDSGVPVRYDIGRLYEDLEHVLIATDRDGKLEPIESTVARKDGYHPDYPFLAVFTGQREYYYKEAPFVRYDRLTLEIRREDGRVVKRSEPVPFYTSGTQRLNRGESLHAPGMFNVDHSPNLNVVTNLAGPSGRYLYGIGDMRRPTGRDALYGGLEVASAGTGLVRFDRLNLEVELLLSIPNYGKWTIIAFDEAESKILLHQNVGGTDEYTYHIFEPMRGRLVDLPLRSGPEGNVYHSKAPSITGDGKKIVYRIYGSSEKIGIHDLASGGDEILNSKEIFSGHRLPVGGVFSFNRDASLFAFSTPNANEPGKFRGIYLYDRVKGTWTEHAIGSVLSGGVFQMSADAQFLFFNVGSSGISNHVWRGSTLNDPDARVYDKGAGYLDDNYQNYVSALMAYDGTRSYSNYIENYSGDYGIASLGVSWLIQSSERSDEPVEWFVDNYYDESDYSVRLAWNNQHRLSPLSGVMSADGRIAILVEPETNDYILMDGPYHDEASDYQ